METVKAYVLVDPPYPPDGVVVGHTYIPSDDTRRHTDFYVCGNQKSAENLVKALHHVTIDNGEG